MTDTQEAMRGELMEYCTRSHPHENMDRECRLLTIIAKLRNESVHTATTIAAKDAEIARLKEENALLEIERDRWQRSSDSVNKKLAAAELSNRQLLEELDGLVALADIAMREANNDGAEYDREENLAASRKLLAQQPSTEALDAYVAKKMDGMQTVRYMRPNSQKWDSAQWAAFGAMADECRSSNLYEDGDAILVWVNEGDICRVGQLIESAPLPPAPDKE